MKRRPCTPVHTAVHAVDPARRFTYLPAGRRITTINVAPRHTEVRFST